MDGALLSRWNACSPGLRVPRVEAVERPVAAVDGLLLVAHRGRHVDAVRDAVAVRDHERRAGVRLGLGQHLDRLRHVGAHRDLRDVDVAVRRGDHARGPSCPALAGRGELRDGAAAASPSTPGRRCSSRPRCRAPGRSRCGRWPARGRVRRTRCRTPSRRHPRSRRSSAPACRRPPPGCGRPPRPAARAARGAARRGAAAAGSARRRRAAMPSMRPIDQVDRPARPRGPPAAFAPDRPARPAPAASRRRTRRCLRTGSSTTPAPARPRPSTTASSGGCRRRSRSSPWRSRPASGRRTAASAP